MVEEREQNVRKTTHASHVHINMFNAPVSLIVLMQYRPYLCQSFSGPDYSVSSYRDIWWRFTMRSFTNGAILLELNVTLNDDITTFT